MNNSDMAALLERADKAGVRLEIVGGLPLWEASPSRRHQQAVDHIRASIQPGPRQRMLATDAATNVSACTWPTSISVSPMAR